jgi:hypothetical protein
VRPPFVVRAKVPPAALAHATLSLTGLIAKNRCIVPVACGVTVGPEADFRDSMDTSWVADVGSSEQESVRAAATVRLPTAT